MKYGMPNLVECKDIYECIDIASSYGLDFIEINMSFPNYRADTLDIPSLIRLKKERDILFTIHADEQLNPFDFDQRVSSCYMEVMRDTVEFAKALDIKVINMHLQKGVYVTLPEKVVLLTDVYRDEYLSKVKSFIAMCEDAIGESGIRIAIENVDTNTFTKSQIEAFELFFSSPVFGLTFDVGHDACMNGKDRHVFEKYPERLVHMHLHDSDGKHAHLPLGEGSVDIGNRISMLSPDSTCLVEVKTLKGLKTSVEYLKSKGYMH